MWVSLASRMRPLGVSGSRHTAIGELLMNYPHPKGRGRRIGVVGPGTGVLATYGQPGDTMRCWEIDPQVKNFEVRGTNSQDAHKRKQDHTCLESVPPHGLF
jgi:hypothetical protein